MKTISKIVALSLIAITSSCLKKNDDKTTDDSRYQPKEYVELKHPDWSKNATIYEDKQLKYSVFKQKTTFSYYITNENCSELVRVESASKHKIKVQMVMQNYKNNVQDSIGISHKNFKFNKGNIILDGISSTMSL